MVKRIHLAGITHGHLNALKLENETSLLLGGCAGAGALGVVWGLDASCRTGRIECQRHMAIIDLFKAIHD